MAWLIKHPTLNLSSGLDLRVMSSSPVLGSTLGVELTKKKKKERKKKEVIKKKTKLTTPGADKDMEPLELIYC